MKMIVLYVAIQPWDYRSAEVEVFTNREDAERQCAEWKKEHPEGYTSVQVHDIEV